MAGLDQNAICKCSSTGKEEPLYCVRVCVCVWVCVCFRVPTCVYVWGGGDSDGRMESTAIYYSGRAGTVTMQW
jgi:hypothetical protein